MVYLSQLTLDPLRPVTLRLMGDTYALHRFLLQAFPEASEGGSGRVLFRAEIERNEARLLVQSQKEPDWRCLEGLLTNLRGPKGWEPSFVTGQRLRFRLRANVTVKKDGKRHALRMQAEQAAWLARQGEQHGFALVPVPSGEPWFDPFPDEPAGRVEVRLVPLPTQTGRKPALGSGHADMPLAHAGVDYDGVLRVTDPVLLARAVTDGIGPGKAFGFGLLSLARLS